MSRTAESITDAELRALFAEHCECRPLNTARTSHSHDCEDEVTQDVRLALHGFVVDDGESQAVSDSERAEARARCAARAPRRRTTMTLRRLAARVQEVAANRDDLDMLVCVRVADNDGDLHVGGLYDVEVDAGCGDEDQLVLDGAQDVVDPDPLEDPDPADPAVRLAMLAEQLAAICARPAETIEISRAELTVLIDLLSPKRAD